MICVRVMHSKLGFLLLGHAHSDGHIFLGHSIKYTFAANLRHGCPGAFQWQGTTVGFFDVAAGKHTTQSLGEE